VHGVTLNKQHRDVTQTYAPEPCVGRRTGRDVNTLPLRLSQGAGDVITSGMPRLLSGATPGDNQRDESFSDAESDPYIFRESRHQRSPDTGSIGDLGDSGVDDVICSIDNRNSTQLSSVARATTFGAGSSLSSGTGKCQHLFIFIFIFYLAMSNLLI